MALELNSKNLLPFEFFSNIFLQTLLSLYEICQYLLMKIFSQSWFLNFKCITGAAPGALHVPRIQNLHRENRNVAPAWKCVLDSGKECVLQENVEL